MATGAGEGPADGEGVEPGNGVDPVTPDAGDWEDVLSLRVENEADGRTSANSVEPRVRLSSLRPPAQPGGTPRGGDNVVVPTSPQEQLPTAPRRTEKSGLRPGEPWHASGEALPDRQTQRQREMERDELLEREKGALRRLSESEHARRAADARVAELERELADLHAQMAYERDAARQAIAAGGNGADLERLRTELAAAQEIIRAIEEAYLAGEGFARGGPST